MTPDLGFRHIYVPPAEGERRTLLLLHGTGGDERDLLNVGRRILPGGGLLSVKGKVLEGKMPRFFRRLAEGVFDEEDVRFRAHELAEFVRAASGAYSIDGGSLIAVGYSNGANIAAAMLLLEPGVLARAVLFRAMVPLTPDPLPALPSTPVLLLAGRRDPIVPGGETERLGDLLSRAGAQVSLEWMPAGHELSTADLEAAIDWLHGR